MVAAKKMQNPPKLAPDELVMAHKDIRQFRDPVTGLLRYSDCDIPFTISLCQNQISQLQLHLA